MAEPNIINNIPNTKFTYTGDDFEGYIITITPINGAKIVTDPAPTYTYYQSNQPDTLTFDNVTEDKVYNSWGILPDPADTPITLNGQTTGGTPQPTAEVVNNITGEDNTETHSVVDNVLNIQVKAKWSTYTFFDVVADYTSTSGGKKQATFEVTGDTATVSISDVDLSQPVILTGLCGRGFTITNNLVNCTVDGLKDIYSPQETITINLTANDGYVFSKSETPPHLLVSEMFGEKTVNFEFEDGATTATLICDLSTLTAAGFKDGYLEGGAIAGETPVVGEKYGAINVYVVTTDELNEFAQGRFYEQQDTGNYVNRIKRLFTDVPTAGDTTISCGNTHTDVHALTPAKQVLTLDFGTVTIPAHNENATDYDAEIRLFVPFHGFVDIPADYAGKNVTLVCLVDIITGKGVAKLTCDGIMFNAYDIEPSQDVIYRTVAQQVNVVGGDTWDNGILYGTEPYVHCKWYASQPAGRGAVQKVSKIGDLTGFNVLTDITPIHTGEMLSDEQETIYSLLQQGVYIE